MRFLFNFLNARRGGRVTYLRNIIDVLNDSSPEDHHYLLVPAATARSLRPVSSRVTLLPRRLAARPLARLFAEGAVVRDLVRRLDIDVYVATANYAPFSVHCAQLLLIRNALLFHQPSDVGAWGRALHAVRRRLCLRSVRRADAVVCPSMFLAQRVSEAIPEAASKVYVVRHGFSGRTFQQDAAACIPSAACDLGRMGALRLVYVALPGAHKNFPVIVRAARIAEGMLQRPVDLLLTVERQQLKGMTATESVVFLGQVPYSQVYGLLRASDIVVYPSLVESFGHPLVEAMFAGIPVIASDIPVCREVCGEAALYANPERPEAFAEAIARVAGDSALRARMISAGRAVASEYSWSAHWVKMRRVAEGLLASSE